MASQIQIFLFALLFGVVLGLFYDVFRVLRLVFECSKKQIFIQDIIYLVTSGFLTFTFILAVNSGEIRFYMIAGEIIGWCTYYLTVGELVVRLTMTIISFCKKVAAKSRKWIVIPISNCIKKAAGKIVYFFKKRCCFRKKLQINQK